jgi:hypothetical protein
MIVVLESNETCSSVVCTIALGTCVYIGAKMCRTKSFELQPAVRE